MLTVVGIFFGWIAIFMSQVTNPFGLYIGFAGLRTFGQGSLTLIPSALVSLWFIRRRGKATAIASLGSSASFATFPPLAHQLISKLGWRNAWIALGVLIWGILLPPVIAIIRRTPESVGLLPDGDKLNPSPDLEGPPLLKTRELNLTTGEAIRTKTFWLLIFAGSSQALISTALVFHQVSIFGTKGIDPGVAAIALTVMAVSSLIGTFFAGILSDKYPNRYILAGAQVVMIAAMLSTFTITLPWHGLLYNGILGISGGLFMTTTSVIWANYFGRKNLGSIRGLATTSMVGFAALGPMPFGFFFDRTGSYSTVIVLFLFLPVACGIAAFLARPPKVIQ
jgi:MFS family permease